MEQNSELTSPVQAHRFEEYRKNNNYDECSPIVSKPEKKINDSEFLNIDAIGDDLNKFLADSKNQEEICQMLGISRKPRREL